MHKLIVCTLVLSVTFLFSPGARADETFFFWYGSAPNSVSWAPYDWEYQEESTGIPSNHGVPDRDHTPDSGDDDQLNLSLVFGEQAWGNYGAHHPTVLPGGVGTVSLWMYADEAAGWGGPDMAGSIYISKNFGSDLVNAEYIGIQNWYGESTFTIVSSENPDGKKEIPVKLDDWNHIEIIDDGSSTKVRINDQEATVALSTGGNSVFITFVQGVIGTDGAITNGDALLTWFYDDIVCTSPESSGIEVVDAPNTGNTVTLDANIESAEWEGANVISYDCSNTERPGVRAQFYGPYTYGSPEDMTNTVYLQHNGQYLYIGLDIVDDVISLRDETLGSWWNDDSVEVYIDEDNSDSTTGGDQISIRADNTAGSLVTGDYADWLDGESQLKADGSGWIVELAVDLAAHDMEVGGTYGFDMTVNDADENPPGAQGTQDWLYGSYETAYYNESYWGNIHLLTGTAVSSWELR